MEYTITFYGVKTIYTLHKALKEGLNLPEYYGMNMDAFWDCITSDIIVPTTIFIEGISSLPKDLTEAKNMLIETLDEVIDWYKDIGIELTVRYVD